ncbi:MAG: phosphoesterase [Methanomicrobiaceae archaeon]|nr:phosphoesterase [Methanomicrobiaceae archaeon]MDD5418708.1 phosphoesterase [Methanomicrobiaceae archaeon]
MNVPGEDALLGRFGFYGGALYIRELGACVAADVHIGLEETLYSQGLHFPLHEEAILQERFRAVIDLFRPSVFVLAGDILHSFDRLGRSVRQKFSSILSTLQASCEVVLVRGSHDVMLPSAGAGSLERYDAGGYTVIHGDLAVEDHGLLVMGHEHPVIEIEMDRFPCFLFGQRLVRGEDVIVLPAFNPLSRGVTINYARRSDFLSPLLRKADCSRLQPVVEAGGEVVLLPPLAAVRRFA